MSRGAIQISRSLIDHPVVGMAHPDRMAAWLWMLTEARWKPVTIEVKGRLIRLERGQFCASVRFMAARWGWHPAAVQRFLTRLKTDTDGDTMIETSSDTGQLVITICNYDKYQRPSGRADTGSDTATDTARDTGAIQERYKQEIREKEGNKDSDAAGAREVPPDAFLDQVREAAGAPENRHWSNDLDLRIAVLRWLALPLSEEEVLHVLRSRRPREQPTSPGYFDGAMAEFAGKKRAPPLTPREPTGPPSRPTGAPPITGILRSIAKQQA